MILLSSIIKSKYVLFDDRKAEESSSNSKTGGLIQEQLSCSKTELYEIYNQREFIIREAKEEAQRIMVTAKKNALTEIAEMKQRGFDEGYKAGVEIGKNKGFNEGYESGIISGREELESQYQKKLQELRQMIAAVEKEKDNIIQKYEKDIEILPLEIAEKIIGDKISMDDDMVSRIIESSIKDFKNLEWIKIYVSGKDDIIKIQSDKNLAEELKKISNDVKIEISKELDKGGCVIETPDTVIDAGIRTQLSNFKEIVLNK